MQKVRDNMGNKQVSINMIANIVSYSSNLIISFLLTPFLINTIGKETYSFYPTANTIVSYMSIITTALNTMASRFVTVSIVKGDEEEANKYYSSVLASNVVLGILLSFPMILVVMFLDRFFNIPINSVAAVKGLFAFVFASTLTNIIGSIFGIATFAKNRIDLRSFRELCTAVLRLILYVVLYSCLKPSILYVGVVTFVVALVNIAFQYVYKRLLLPEIHVRRKYISLKHTKELLSSSIWNMISSFGNTLLAGMSLVLANIFYGVTVSGTYSIVQIVPQFINGVIVMLVGVFYPVITYKYAQEDKKGLLQEINRAQKIVGFFSCTTIVVFSCLAKEFFSLWTPGENAQYLSILSIATIFPHLFIACLWSLTNVNVVMNKVKIPAIITMSIGVINVLLAYIIFKLFQPGLLSLPLISTGLQLFWIGFFYPQYVSKNLQVKWYTFYGPLVRAIGCAIPVSVMVLLLKKFVILNTWVKFILFGGCMGICGLIIFACGMFGFNKIKQWKNDV